MTSGRPRVRVGAPLRQRRQGIIQRQQGLVTGIGHAPRAELGHPRGRERPATRLHQLLISGMTRQQSGAQPMDVGVNLAHGTKTSRQLLMMQATPGWPFPASSQGMSTSPSHILAANIKRLRLAMD